MPRRDRDDDNGDYDNGNGDYDNDNGDYDNRIKITKIVRSPLSILVSFFWTLVSFFAIYLSFKCNKGFNFGHFLAACCCAPFYIAIMLGTSYEKCFS